MKFYETSFQYDYSFPAVSLAYFLRYPNPYSKHVLSTDVIDRHIDPVTKRLHTTRLHLKRSKVPSGILRFLPKGLAGPGGASQSFVLETSTVDVQEGWMETESRNMEWTGILSVREKQFYRRQVPVAAPDTWVDKLDTADMEASPARDKEWTSCKTTVTFVSRIGQAKLRRAKQVDESSDNEEEPAKQGFFAALSTAGIQKTVEMVGVKRTHRAMINGARGMNVVLERLRSGGLMGVLEGMRRDRMEMMNGPWQQVWQEGLQNSDRRDD